MKISKKIERCIEVDDKDHSKCSDKCPHIHPEEPECYLYPTAMVWDNERCEQCIQEFGMGDAVETLLAKELRDYLHFIEVKNGKYNDIEKAILEIIDRYNKKEEENE